MCSYLTGSLSLIHFSLFKLSTIKWTWNVCDIPTLTNRVTTERYYFFHVYLHFCTVGNSRTQIVQIIESFVACVSFFNLRDFRLQIVDAFCLGCLAAVNTDHTTWRDVRLLSLVFHRMFFTRPEFVIWVLHFSYTTAWLQGFSNSLATPSSGQTAHSGAGADWQLSSLAWYISSNDIWEIAIIT